MNPAFFVVAGIELELHRQRGAQFAPLLQYGRAIVLAGFYREQFYLGKI